MSKLVALLITCLVCSVAIARPTTTKGYVKKNGAYVAPHAKTTPDKTKNNNYSARGNVNPTTGKEGTKPRDGEAGQTRP